MDRDRAVFGRAVAVALWVVTGCARQQGVGQEGLGFGEPIGGDTATYAAAPERGSGRAYTSALLTAGGSGVHPPLPGQAARSVLDEQVNEAENLFFTDDGRLFVSAAEDIYEIARAEDETYTKTDHFAEDCVVEGIIQLGRYLYGVCTWNDADGSARAFLLGGELSERPMFRTIAPLEPGSAPNGMTVDEDGRIYITCSLTDQIIRVTLGAPLQVERTDVWADGLTLVNGIKYIDHAMYVTVLEVSLNSRFLRIPMLPDGSAGTPKELYRRALTLLDDIIPFEGGFIITDFVNGTLMFWDQARGLYAETPAWTFYGPTSLAQGRPPMFSERELIVAEKGTYLVRDELNGDLLSMYELP